MKSSTPLLVTVALFAGALPLAACTVFSGIEDLPGQSAQAGAGGATGAAGVGGAAVSGQAASSSSGPPPPMMLAAEGVSLSEIAVYQGVKRSVMKGGSPATGVPVVEGRDALVRLFVTTDATYDHSPVTAHLFLGEGSMPLEVMATPAGMSTDDALGSTINFDVPAASLVKGMNFRVELLQPSAHTAGTNAGASYPATGFTALDVQSTGPSLKITLVPVAYGGDGSGRLPDTSAAQIKAYKDAFYALYPIQKLDITVRAPFSWQSTISANGGGWSQLLDAVAKLRQQDGAPPDVYYYAPFEPASSFNGFCGGGCVAGLGMIGSPIDSYSRAAIGLGYTGDIAMTTVTHEIGHTQGRQHAPCGGAQGVDPAFPYAGGGIGAWGYNLLTKQLISPTAAKDLMGYCSPNWISDYTYQAIFKEIKAVNNASIVYPAEELDRVYERARIEPDGHLTWLDPVKMHTPLVGESRQIDVTSAIGTQPVAGHYFPYDHVLGGVILWPEGKEAIASIAVKVDGKVQTLVR